MPVPQFNTDEIITHLESDAIWELLKFVIEAVFVYGLILLNKANIASSKPRVVGVIIALLLLLVTVASALYSHERKGFTNGALFAINCFVSILLVSVVVYPFVKKHLENGIKRLDWSEHFPRGKTYKWELHSGSDDGSKGNSVAVVADTSSKSLRFGSQSSDRNRRWANMEIQFDEVHDLRQWVGISFNLKCIPVYPETTIALQIVTSGDTRYLSAKPVLLHDQRALFLFQEMFWADWSTKPSQGHLDLQHIERIAVVCRTNCENVEFSVSDFALVKHLNDDAQVVKPITESTK